MAATDVNEWTLARTATKSKGEEKNMVVVRGASKVPQVFFMNSITCPDLFSHIGSVRVKVLLIQLNDIDIAQAPDPTVEFESLLCPRVSILGPITDKP